MEAFDGTVAGAMWGFQYLDDRWPYIRIRLYECALTSAEVTIVYYTYLSDYTEDSWDALYRNWGHD